MLLYTVVCKSMHNSVDSLVSSYNNITNLLESFDLKTSKRPETTRDVRLSDSGSDTSLVITHYALAFYFYNSFKLFIYHPTFIFNFKPFIISMFVLQSSLQCCWVKMNIVLNILKLVLITLVQLMRDFCREIGDELI